MLKRIDTKQDMLDWAHQVNQGMNNAQKCDYQDIWGHSSPETLKKLFLECESDRALILCSVYNTMSYDAVEELLMHLAKTKARKVLDEEMEYYNKELAKKEKDLADRKASFTDCLKGYWRRIRKLRVRVSDLEGEVERSHRFEGNFRKEVFELQKQLDQYKKKAENYDLMRSLMTEKFGE